MKGFLVLASFLLVACAAPHEPRKCPMGNLAHIEAPEHMAMQTAAQATEKHGYDEFTIVSAQGRGNDYKMLIKMSDRPDNLIWSRLR